MPRFVYNQKSIELALPYRDEAEYLKARSKLVEAQRATRFDSGMTLSPLEESLNATLIAMRNREIQNYKTIDFFPPANYFPTVKAAIERSPLFPLLKVMPKGAVLHLHSSSMGSPQDLLELTYLDNCYMYTGNAGVYGQLAFYRADTVPAGWEPVSALRAKNPGFDEQLLQLLTIGPEGQNDPDIWRQFNDIFTRTSRLVRYLPAFFRYTNQVLNTYQDDQIQHIEVRSGFGNLYDLDNNSYGPKEQLEFYRQILANHPGMSMAFIYSTTRSNPLITVYEQMEQAIQLRAAFPDLVIGFDLVGEEDQGYSLLYFVPDFLRVGELEEKYQIDLPFYFHSGESDWADITNLYDAVLLGSRRIGHGYNLFYFPILIPLLRAAQIPLELCPISNQVLNYVADLRDHPAGGYLNEGVQLTLNSDDPAIYGNTGVTYDFWEALMAWELDLKSLKQLAYNSITTSGLDETRKNTLLLNWQNRWEQFIESMA